MADPSFDVVSKVDRQEADNALNQAAKELPAALRLPGHGRVDRLGRRERHHHHRVDRGTMQGRDRGLQGEADQARHLAEVVRGRRAGGLGQGVQGHRHPGPGHRVGQGHGDLQADPRPGTKGVQAQIQGDQLRVSGKKKDDLQSVIALLEGADLGVALQFDNYR